MQPLTHHINGHHLAREESHALLLDQNAAEQHLRLAFIVRGTERHVFPALALDDWGREHAGLGLYRWIYEEGPLLPRSELFGFTTDGDQTQIFLRDLEVSFRYPCYIYRDAGEPLENGQLLTAIFTSGANHQDSPRKIEPPTDLPWALRRAAVRWRQVNLQALSDAGWEPLHYS